MSRDEAVALTVAMRDSGVVLDWSDLDGPVLDKHSTGGVGDNVSLMLAPAVAACGAFVPMISGRGLGHTGGTLDKLDSIPGYTTQPDSALFRRVVADVGCAVIGQTANLAPADKRLYAIRDVTATVESIPLITASILSKKLAAVRGAVVLDVKTGNGAFMQRLEDSRALAKSIVEVANGAGLAASALITDMNQPLASAAGNAVEVLNAVEFLTGKHIDRRLFDVTVALGGELLVLGGVAKDDAEGRHRIEEAFSSGAAADLFGRMVAALGGPSDFVERPEAHLTAAPVVKPVAPERPGIVAAIDTRAVGIAVVELGGGRMKPEDAIDHSVGFTRLAGLGAKVGPDAPLALVHARDEGAAERAAKSLRAAYALGTAPKPGRVVYERIGA
jgi:thymidine phosphorylase